MKKWHILARCTPLYSLVLMALGPERDFSYFGDRFVVFGQENDI